MSGQKTFTVTRKVVNTVFYLTLLICAITFISKTWHLFQSESTVAGLAQQVTLDFAVMSFVKGRPKPSPSYEFADDKRAALQGAVDRYVLHVPYRSPLGYYNYLITLVFIAGAVYGMWLLRSIFYSITIPEPFTHSNALRMRNIGLLLIATDALKFLNYIIFGWLANGSFRGKDIQLLTDVGMSFWLGLLILTLAIVYRRGVEIYSEQQLTV